MGALIPIFVIGILILHLTLRLINKATIKKAMEKDWQKKQDEIKARAANRKKRGGGTKFKATLIDNPNEKKWQKFQSNPRAARKRL